VLGRSISEVLGREDWRHEANPSVGGRATVIAVTATAVALQLKPQTMEAIGRWISLLLSKAIMGALLAVLLNFVGSLIVPEYWWPPVPDSWDMAGAGALGGMLTHCFKSIAPRKSENSN
jgi:hypothetical protein